MNKEPRASHTFLRQFAAAVFENLNVPADHARRGADTLVDTSLRGVDTHGIRNLKRYYVDDIERGLIDPSAGLTTEGSTPVSDSQNANGGLGISLATHSMETAITKAHESGVGLVTVRNANHFGAAGQFASMALEHDMIGVASTGCFFPHGQSFAVLPFGGLIAMLSTNPIALAAPAGDLPPFLLDMSTAIAPCNRIERWQELGREIPDGWAKDPEGNWTSDPERAKQLIPLGGLGLLGGHKGYGLSLAVQIMTCVLSGGWRQDPDVGAILGDNPRPFDGYGQERMGQFFAAIRIDQFAEPDVFKARLQTMIRALNESPAVDGADQVLVPGQLEAACWSERMRDGIPLPPSTLADFRALSERFHLPLEFV